ncbi:SlyX family protein [Crateriforma conspicua]|uniref:Protein SlyX n=1 Tax=Crateriforma conspicua TaxID=2527996 RepID=A0A5C5XY80_9PLAN|nr:SlyX family protein [Crateriforma conspicua]QDV63308.1 hypothetical protein Mal65_24500 [Crateriforma conspicua]TWT67920.1 hypothetical protein Pan14r_01580 [Crateriforma conspicua]
MNRDPEHRLTQLEIQLAHQIRLLDQLNDVVVEHGQRLMQQERTIRRLRDEIKSLKAGGGQDEPPMTLEDERPPHY